MSGMPRVLIVNAGSSSLKWDVLDGASEASLRQDAASWEASPGGGHADELAAALRVVPSIDAVGHRVVRGGARFRSAVRVDRAVRDAIVELVDLAPLHNPAAVAGIDAATQRFPDVPEVAAFDTAYHASIPDAAAIYPLPWEWTQRWGVRRFGFHGLSVEYAAGRAAELVVDRPPLRRLVVCHLGAGCSITAVHDGRSVDTSMGFTPLEGLMMARRAGSLDPGLLLYLLGRPGLDAAELDHALNERSGLLGVSGIGADMRAILAAEANGDERAQLAVEMFLHRLVAAIGAMAATLGGLDGLVFTGGLGEHSAAIRARTCDRLGYLGVRLDDAANTGPSGDADVADATSTARVLVVAAREDLAILRQVKRLLGWP